MALEEKGENNGGVKQGVPQTGHYLRLSPHGVLFIWNNNYILMVCYFIIVISGTLFTFYVVVSIR